jgi:hypothetical protein
MEFSKIQGFVLRYKYFFATFAIYFFSVFVLFYSPLREYWRSGFAPADRKVLAVASGAMFRDARIQRVVKVLTPEGINLEIYGPLEKGVQPRLDTVFIQDRRDAFFDLQGRATNLALKDMDGDGRPEIIAPTYDRDGVAHLNVFSYDLNTNKFTPFLN